MSASLVRGFDYRVNASVDMSRQQFQELERKGYRRQVDGARGETWYRDPSTDRIAVEAYSVIPAAPVRQEI